MLPKVHNRECWSQLGAQFSGQVSEKGSDYRIMEHSDEASWLSQLPVVSHIA
jgi:hypothetical protein